jgi:hypothetical protein
MKDMNTLGRQNEWSLFFLSKTMVQRIIGVLQNVTVNIKTISSATNRYEFTVNLTPVHKACRLLYGDRRSKAIPLQVWKGPEGSSRLRLPDFKTIGT